MKILMVVNFTKSPLFVINYQLHMFCQYAQLKLRTVTYRNGSISVTSFSSTSLILLPLPFLPFLVFFSLLHNISSTSHTILSKCLAKPYLHHTCANYA